MMGGIHWRRDEARLKSYAAATSAKGGATVRVEIVVTDPMRLGLMLQELAEIQRDQDAAAREKPRPKKGLPPTKPLLLTYGGGS